MCSTGSAQGIVGLYWVWLSGRYRLTGPALERVFPAHLCITRWEYAAMPTEAKVRLAGKSSYFGFHVQAVSERR